MIKEFQGQFRWLSNFVPVEIELGDFTYSSVEHAYMSAKSDSIEWKEFCADSNNTPGDVKRKSRNIKLKSDWENIKITVMEECLNQKFRQEPYKSKLLSTKNLHIQEGNNWNDKFWGVCLKTNKGENNLGKLIMKIRDTLRLEQATNE